MNTFWTLLFILGAYSHVLGYAIAHSTIATECERLGGFYVENKTYKCVEIKGVKRE